MASPLIVAHRGASAVAPENTLTAFAAAADAGADLVEMDVRLTADGVAVVLHDADVSVATDGSGWVHDLTLAELRSLDASGGAGERVPTLEEALAALRARGLGVDLEIKNLPGDPGFEAGRERALEAALAAIQATSFHSPLIVSSFSWHTIERCRELAPGIETGFLTIGAIDPRAGLDYARDAGHRWILPQAPALLEAGEAFLEEARAEGVRVGTWTVDDRDILRTLVRWNVDAIASNDPSLAVEVRASVQQ